MGVSVVARITRHMANILRTQIAPQVLGHFRRFIKSLQFGLMQIGEQVLHVQCFDTLGFQPPHVFDQRSLARPVSMTFAENKSPFPFIQPLDKRLFTRRSSQVGEAGARRRCVSGQGLLSGFFQAITGDPEGFERLCLRACALLTVARVQGAVRMHHKVEVFFMGRGQIKRRVMGR